MAPSLTDARPGDAADSGRRLAVRSQRGRVGGNPGGLDTAVYTLCTHDGLASLWLLRTIGGV
jgi:hypothetical protein